MPKQARFTFETFLDGNRVQNTHEVEHFLNRHYHRRDLDLAIAKQAEFIYLARYKKDIVGLSASLLETDHEEATLILYVHPRWRNQGIGNKLFTQTVSAVQTIGFDPYYIAFSPHDDQSLARFLLPFGMSYQYSDLLMSYDNQKPLTAPPRPSNVAIVSYRDDFYNEMVDLRNIGIHEDQILKNLPQRPIFRREDLTYRQWMRSQTTNSFVLLVDGVFRGFTMAANDGEIRSVVVDPAVRGQGFAKMLIIEALNYQIRHNRHEIYLWVAQKNDVARHIYTKLGFSLSDRYDASYGKPIIHM